MQGSMIPSLFELTILLAGNALTSLFIELLKEKIRSEISPITNRNLPWVVRECQGKTLEAHFRKKLEDQARKMVVVCVTDSVDSVSSKTLMEEIANFSFSHQPFVIFSAVGDNQSALDSFKTKLSKFSYDMRQISLINHNEKSTNELVDKLFEIFSYFNQLGDAYEFPYKEKEQHHKNTHLFTLNIFVTGLPGSGKSTFCNILLDEKKAFAGMGLAYTSRILRYIHKKYPFAVYDSPGITENTIDTVVNYIKDRSPKPKSTIPPHEQIHAIIYVKFNYGRNLVKNEESFLTSIKKLSSNVPLFYLITNVHEKEIKNKDFFFRKDYGPLIKKENSSNIFYAHQVKPYFGIEIFIEALMKYMLQYPSFTSYFNNRDVISDKSIFRTARNEVFQRLLEYKPMTTLTTNRPEVKRAMLALIKDIFLIYNIDMNEEDITPIEQLARDRYLNQMIVNDFTEKDQMFIQPRILSKINYKNYLTFIAVQAYQYLEKKIQALPKLFDSSRFCSNYFYSAKIEIVQDMVAKYSS